MSVDNFVRERFLILSSYLISQMGRGPSQLSRLEPSSLLF